MMKMIGKIQIENECCKGRPVAIFDNQNGTFACECECGMWCTTAHSKVSDAVRDYEEMTKRSRWRMR